MTIPIPTGTLDISVSAVCTFCSVFRGPHAIILSTFVLNQSIFLLNTFFNASFSRGITVRLLTRFIKCMMLTLLLNGIMFTTEVFDVQYDVL